MDGKWQIANAVDSDEDDLTFTSRDWSRADGNIRNDGYRVGLEASQEEQLQTGFNAGFQEALRMAVAAGKLQGELCSVLAKSKESIGTSPSAIDAGTSPPTSLSYDSLLSSCSNLISQIPAYLKPGDFTMAVSKQVEDCRDIVSPQSSTNIAPALTSSHSPDTDSTVVASSKGDIVTSSCAASASETAKVNTNDIRSSVCETVCRNRSGFWTQLESFKDQALEFT